MVYQLGSGLLDACVLSGVSHGDAYGYTLTQQVRNVVDISEVNAVSGFETTSKGRISDDI
jgi:PadR family transcriptional regulator PadR